MPGPFATVTDRHCPPQLRGEVPFPRKHLGTLRGTGQGRGRVLLVRRAGMRRRLVRIAYVPETSPLSPQDAVIAAIRKKPAEKGTRYAEGFAADRHERQVWHVGNGGTQEHTRRCQHESQGDSCWLIALTRGPRYTRDPRQ